MRLTRQCRSQIGNVPVFGTLPDQPAVGARRSRNMRAPSAHVPKLDSKPGGDPDAWQSNCSVVNFLRSLIMTRNEVVL